MSGGSTVNNANGISASALAARDATDTVPIPVVALRLPCKSSEGRRSGDAITVVVGGDTEAAKAQAREIIDMSESFPSPEALGRGGGSTSAVVSGLHTAMGGAVHESSGRVWELIKVSGVLGDGITKAANDARDTEGAVAVTIKGLGDTPALDASQAARRFVKNADSASNLDAWVEFGQEYDAEQAANANQHGSSTVQDEDE
jgi:hypothetical protein